MSGAKRVWSSTVGSIFLVAANSDALFSTPDSALRPISNTGMDALDIDMGTFPPTDQSLGRCGNFVASECRVRNMGFRVGGSSPAQVARYAPDAVARLQAMRFLNASSDSSATPLFR